AIGRGTQRGVDAQSSGGQSGHLGLRDGRTRGRRRRRDLPGCNAHGRALRWLHTNGPRRRLRGRARLQRHRQCRDAAGDHSGQLHADHGGRAGRGRDDQGGHRQHDHRPAMMAMRSLLLDQRGFSLAELLMVVAILGLMLAGLVFVQQQGQQSYLMGAHRVEAQQNARVALDLMVRELRSAQTITAVPSGTDITFVDENGVTIEYQCSGATINRITGGVATPLIGGAQTFLMTYFSAFDGPTNTGTVTATAAGVRLVRIQLVTGTDEQVASYSDSNQRATIESIVRLRNM